MENEENHAYVSVQIELAYVSVQIELAYVSFEIELCSFFSLVKILGWLDCRGKSTCLILAR
jgi:hypothetical protein